MDDRVVREQLVELLTGGHAHLTVDKALRGLDPEARGKRPAEGLHSVWEELEHMRRAQEDILRYTLDAAWKSPAFPEGYWPERPRPAEMEWKASVKAFRADLDEVVALARDEERDLTARLPHGEGRTYLRQVLLVADHNAYHLGQIVQTRKLLGAWRG
ncbi:MAG TPA: DinB family protein [Vicinamibacteria bacterium]